MDFQSLISSIFNVKLLIIFSVSFVFLILTKLRKKRNIPPGPRSFTGIAKLFKPFAHKYLYELIKQYGSIIELSILGQPMIIFGNYDAIKEAFVTNGDNFMNRPKSCVFQEYCQNKGLIFTDGENWKEQKKFAISHLIKSGLQDSHDSIILHELELAYNEINKHDGKSFDPKQLIVQMTTNIVMQMAASERSDYNEIQDLIHQNMDEIVYNFRMSNPVNFFPPLKYILKSHKKYKQSIQILRHYLVNIVNNHENSFDPKNLRDYTDAFLLKMHEERNKGNTKTSFTKEYLISNLMDFILAGSETSSFTLLFAIIYLLHHPHIQTKIQKEIDDVIGSSRSPVMADCRKLPFTFATILEAQRYSSITPLAAARTATKDIKIQGYDIPKGSFVMPHIYAMHFDPKYWKNPQSFDPNHFLDKNGGVIKDIKSFWPFSTGHRECMGETLAQKELFLIFTSLLQRYSFKATEPELPSMTGCLEGSALSPLPYKVFFIVRS